MKKLYILIVLLFCFAVNAQNTAIPDPIFEQALIDLGIDSDGIINGQVLTSDIETVTTLNLDHKGIEDLTGIEDFMALEILDATGNKLTLLDVSNNVQLKELYCSSDSAGFNMPISILDLSNNINLEILYGENLIFLENLNVKNGNNSILSVFLFCEFEGEPCELSELHCVTVDDEQAATNDDPPYSNWYIEADYFYSEDCALGIQSQEGQGFSIYPNPATQTLVLNSKGETGNLNIKIFNVEGKLLSTQAEAFQKQASLDVSNLSKGMYFLNIEAENGRVETHKFIKE